MPETGIEDLIRGDGNDGCGGILLAAGICVVVLLVVLGLITAFCGPAPEPNTNTVVNGR